MANRAQALVQVAQYNEDTFDIGDVKWSARRVASSGWLLANGAAVSRTTYSDLFAAIVPLLGGFTVTIAVPGVFSLTAHGLVIGDAVYFETSGALPTGLAVSTIYYVVSVPTADTFEVSATSGGSAITTTGTQSGTHNAWLCPYGLGDGSTTFNVPDSSGRTLVAASGTGGHVDVQALGGNDGTALQYRRPKHQHGSHHHSITNYTTSVSGATGAAVEASGSTTTGDTLVGETANDPMNAPANLVLNLFVKYA